VVLLLNLAHVAVGEQRPSERVVPALCAFEAGLDRVAAALAEAECLDRVRIVHVVREGEVSQRVLVAGDALCDQVVLLGSLEIAADRLIRFGLPDDRLGEVVVGARRVAAGP